MEELFQRAAKIKSFASCFCFDGLIIVVGNGFG